MIGNVVGGYWDLAYGCDWADPAVDLDHAIRRRFDWLFASSLLGVLAIAFCGLLAPLLYSTWPNRSRKTNG